MALTGDSFDFIQGGVVTSSAQLVDAAATVGDVLTVQSDKSVAAEPGGGSQPVQAIYDGNVVTIANNAQGSLTFDSLNSGTPLLDISTPDAPTFLEAGTYAITGGYSASVALTAGGFCVASINSNAAANMTAVHPDLAGEVLPLTLVAEAGAPCGLTIINKDGVEARDFALSGFVIVKLA